MSQTGKDYIGYEYKEITVNTDQVSMYLDCYENFGWHADDKIPITNGMNQTTIKLKRDRKIINKMELTRLQRNFEACAREIELLEKAKTSSATMWSLAAGILGTAFMACSIFAVIHNPPIIWLCVLFAIPGLTGWIAPVFLYRGIAAVRTQKMQPLLEEKYEEIFEVCEKGHSLI